MLTLVSAFVRSLRISRGSGSPDSGARRSRSSRTGTPTGKPTGACGRGPPIWRSTSSSSSRCALRPPGLCCDPLFRPDACSCMLSCQLVLVDWSRYRLVSGQADPGPSRRDSRRKRWCDVSTLAYLTLHTFGAAIYLPFSALRFLCCMWRGVAEQILSSSQ
jgi:hypothetical protein